MVGVFCASLAACSIVRDAPFRGAEDRVTDATLVGPFDGRIVDENTGEPVADATVVAVWSFDSGDGLIGPEGSKVRRVETDAAGRYRVPKYSPGARGPTTRLVSFRLTVYKRGYAAYRSDRLADGTPRNDFTVRHNDVALRKWSETDSHGDHYLNLRAPRDVLLAARWERNAANLDLYRELGGSARIENDPAETVTPAAPTGPAAPEQPTSPKPLPAKSSLLDATGMMSPSEMQMRTGDEGAFAVDDLGDLPRTAFYQGVHFQAVDRGEEYDVAYRVWYRPEGGLDPVIARFRATFPDIAVTDDVTEQTWIYDAPDIRAVAFIDAEHEAGVLLTCGAAQCVDIESAIILAKFLRKNLDRVRSVSADEAGAVPEANTQEGETSTSENEDAASDGADANEETGE